MSYSTDAAGENIIAADKIINAGTYYVVVKDKDVNDEVTITSTPKSFTIKQKEVEVKFIDKYEFTYGDEVVTPKCSFTDSADQTEVTDIKEGSDYTVTYWEDSQAYTLLDKAPEDAGSYLIRILQVDSGNYALNQTDRAFEIIKNTTSYQNKELNKKLLVGDNSVNLADLLCPGAKITAESITTADTNGIFETKPTFDANSKEIKFKLNKTAPVGTTGNITVTVKSKNYADYTIIIKVTVFEKINQESLNITNANSVNFGEKLKLSAEGGSTNTEITYIITNGTGKASLESIKNEYFLVGEQAGEVTVKAKKAGDETYLDVESSEVTITINKIDATGTPVFTEVNKAGVKLNEVVLKDTNGGTFTWNIASPGTPETTEVKQGQSYEWTYIPQGNDANNYKPITRTVVLYPAPPAPPIPGGGGVAPTPTVPEVVKPNIPTIPDQGADIGMTEQRQAETDKTIRDIIADLVKPDAKSEQPVPQTPAEKETAKTEGAIAKAIKNNKQIKINVETEKVDENKATEVVKHEISEIKNTVKEIYGEVGGKLLQLANIEVNAVLINDDGTTVELGNLRPLDKKISFTFQLLKTATGEKYGVVRYHDGKAEILPSEDVTYDSVTKKITFKTDRFSTYAVFEYEKEPEATPVPPVEPTVPGMVQNVKVKTDNGLLKVTFDKVTDADSYRVYVKEVGAKGGFRWFHGNSEGTIIKQLYKKALVKNGKY